MLEIPGTENIKVIKTQVHLKENKILGKNCQFKISLRGEWTYKVSEKSII